MGRGSVFFGQDADDILCGLAKIGGVSDFWEVKGLWEELENVCVLIGRSQWYIAVVTVVVVGGRSNVPIVVSVG